MKLILVLAALFTFTLGMQSQANGMTGKTRGSRASKATEQAVAAQFNELKQAMDLLCALERNRG